MTVFIERARLFAIAAHSAVGQFRKYTGEPYYVHTQRVAHLVSGIFFPDGEPYEEAVAAAHLHDVVEDTRVGLGLVSDLFGPTVAGIVSGLTDVSKPGDGNRERRKAMDRAHLAAGGYAVQTIKCADLIDNTETIVQFDPGFAAVYMREKRQLLDVMPRADRRLWDRADAIVRDYEAKKNGGAG